jgi:hypothetical protein
MSTMFSSLPSPLKPDPKVFEEAVDRAVGRIMALYQAGGGPDCPIGTPLYSIQVVCYCCHHCVCS